MIEIVKRIILAYKRTFGKKLKKRSAIDRYKARQYYKSHKPRIRLQRRKYNKKNKVYMKSRKLFKRTKPSWMTSRSKPKTFKPKPYKPYKPKKIKATKPGKIYAPKRRISRKT